MEIMELIRQRKSTMAYSGRDVTEYEMQLLFEAARWAPSSYNGQPWRFIYANKSSNPELYGQIFDLLAEFNKAWAKHAPVLMLTMARSRYEDTEEEYKHSWHDLGLAMGNMHIMATSLGISLHEMAGFSAEKAKIELNIPEKIEPVSIVAIGFPGDVSSLPLDIHKIASKIRSRKAVSEFAFNHSFNKAELDKK